MFFEWRGKNETNVRGNNNRLEKLLIWKKERQKEKCISFHEYKSVWKHEKHLLWCWKWKNEWNKLYIWKGYATKELIYLKMWEGYDGSKEDRMNI